MHREFLKRLLHQEQKVKNPMLKPRRPEENLSLILFLKNGKLFR